MRLVLSADLPVDIEIEAIDANHYKVVFVLTKSNPNETEKGALFRATRDIVRIINVKDGLDEGLD